MATQRIQIAGTEYEYIIKEGPWERDHQPELEQTNMGSAVNFHVWLEDSKNGWVVGECETYSQALTIIGLDLIRHAKDLTHED